MTSSNLKSEYDIVFAGGEFNRRSHCRQSRSDMLLGGTAACVTAARLSKADPSLSILLIEQGGDNLDDPAIVTPAMFLSHLFPGSKTILFHAAKKESSLADRALVVPSGGLLGGGSSINFTMYTRGAMSSRWFSRTDNNIHI